MFEEEKPESITTVINGETVNVTNNFEFPYSFYTIQIHFAKDAYNPGGNTNTHDVTNPANYMIIQPGVNGNFQTVSCKQGPQGDDVRVKVNSVTFSNNDGAGPFASTLKLNDNKRLPVGRYQLYLCGTTSLMDANGHKINDGRDVVRSFSIDNSSVGEPEAGPGGGGSSGGNGQNLPEDGIGAYYYENGVKKYAWYHSKLPATGFAPGHVTHLKHLSASPAYEATQIRLRIPSLYVDTSILGVPNVERSYDVSWLGSNAGWLQDTPFPGRLDAGNCVITGYNVNSEGDPGIFIGLERLHYGEPIFIQAFGEIYTYLVESVDTVLADTPQVLSQQTDRSELTLLTCKYWNENTHEYDGRIVVHAVLDSISADE